MLQHNDRRAFLKLAAGGLAMSRMPVVGTARADPSDTPADCSNRVLNYFDKKTPLTISMWDFSWLMGHYPGGPYENLAKRVEEAARRGYNTLRIDCFPSHILLGKFVFERKYLQGEIIPCWGDTAIAHEENVLKKVAELAQLCRQNNIWLGLDSWDKKHMIGHDNILRPDEEEKTFTEFSQTWVKALRLMREEGILERAVWIAPMNEVPHFTSGKLESARTVEKKNLQEGETEYTPQQKLDMIHKRINHWIGAAIKQEISREGIPLSYSSLGAEYYGKRLTDIYDVVDVHIMPGVITDANDQKAIGKAQNGVRGGGFLDMEKYNLSAWSDAWQTACRKNYQKMLERAYNFLKGQADRCTTDSGKRLVPIVTESFGPCFFPDHKDVDWTWYKYYNADAARVLTSLPYAGTSLSNYAEPLFRLWEDADWHRNTNLYIKAMAKTR